MSHVHNIIISLGPSQTIFPHLRFCFLVSFFSYQTFTSRQHTFTSIVAFLESLWLWDPLWTRTIQKFDVTRCYKRSETTSYLRQYLFPITGMVCVHRESSYFGTSLTHSALSYNIFYHVMNCPIESTQKEEPPSMNNQHSSPSLHHSDITTL